MAAIRLNEVRARVAAAAGRAGRSVDEVTLVAVTKAADDEQVRAAYAAGHRDFGENRAKALVARAAMMPDDVTWHAVGRVQGNKVRKIRPVTSLLHSLDRPELARYWVRGPAPAPPALVQVNIGREPQKAGVAPSEAEGLVALAEGLGIEVRGLMAILPVVTDPECARAYFAELSGLRDRICSRHPGVAELSMGMTDDFEVAVEEGGTILRVGRAIFDPSDETT